MIRTAYDPINKENLTWHPLTNNERTLQRNSLGEQAFMEIGAFGTCGDPSAPEFASWRTDHLLPIAKLYDVHDKIFNPEVAEWTPLRAPVEGIHFARATVLGVAVTKQTESNASIAEAGLAAYSGVLRGQEASVCIQEGDGLSEQQQFIRRLAKSVLEATAVQYPLFTLTDDLNVLSHKTAAQLAEKIRLKNSGVSVDTKYKLPAERQDLVPGVNLTGTLGEEKPAWLREIQERLDAYDVPTSDNYEKDWQPENGIDYETINKLNTAIQLVAITKDTKAFGPLAELGPRMMHAHLSGQSVGVYIEPHPSAQNSSANRTRILVKEHLSRLREDFPNLPIFVAQTLDELAMFGLVEFFKQRQRLQA
jgi:hypothetical protein